MRKRGGTQSIGASVTSDPAWWSKRPVRCRPSPKVSTSGNHGRYVILGLWGAIGTQPISPRDLSTKNLTIAGASFPKPKHYHGAMHLAARVQDQFPLAALISHRFSIERAIDALAAVKSGEAIKAVIDPQL